MSRGDQRYWGAPHQGKKKLRFEANLITLECLWRGVVQERVEGVVPERVEGVVLGKSMIEDPTFG